MNELLLNSRLRNCLMTVLELEKSLQQTPLGPALQREFRILKRLVRNFDDLDVQESDVCRIELATTNFLAEIKETLEGVYRTSVVSSRFLQ